MRALVSNIKSMASICNGSFTHVFREANSAADHLANLTIQRKAAFTMNVDSLDNHLKATTFLESMDVPYFRSR
ncbi:hypothetical protein LIER_36870 [Lithospermum erythrorhizon]|uniref:RNase H type-1 domain-containing protein n=1 Tax=Lithospermum erythrorhizon TaxID=34254 RepID=A0AAV3PD36_LITER